MVSQVATSLRDALAQKMQELEEGIRGVDEDAAGRRPAAGEWCVKEVLSHLCKDEGESLVHNLRRLADEDTPLIGFASGLPFYTAKRQGMRVAELLAVVRGQYDEMASFVGGLSDEQLGRKGRVPILRDTPIGEYPTLAQFAGAMINLHLNDHINQIRDARQQAGG